jgi:hypothetical protein
MFLVLAATNRMRTKTGLRSVHGLYERWGFHKGDWGEKRNAYRILVGSQKLRDHWEDLAVGGWKISKWILER